MTRETLRQYEHLLCELEEERSRLIRKRAHDAWTAETLGAYSLFGVDDSIQTLEQMVGEYYARHQRELVRIHAWIETIEDSRTRRAFKLRYLDGKSWVAASQAMRYSDESGARKLCERYLDRNEEKG